MEGSRSSTWLRRYFVVANAGQEVVNGAQGKGVGNLEQLGRIDKVIETQALFSKFTVTESLPRLIEFSRSSVFTQWRMRLIALLVLTNFSQSLLGR